MKTPKEKIYGYFKERGCATVPELQKAFSLDYHTVRSILQRMTEEKTIAFKSGLVFRFVKEERKESEGKQNLFKWFDNFNSRSKSDSVEEEKKDKKETNAQDVFDLCELTEDDVEDVSGVDGDSVLDDAEEDEQD